MSISPAARELENRYFGDQGEPTLGPALGLILDQWRSGDRERELGLHLLFLAWYLMVEPPFLTGLDETRVSSEELAAVFREVHDWLLPDATATQDAEVLYVTGLMASLAPWLLGDSEEWTRRSEAYRTRYRELMPSGLDPQVFEGRGAYGEYFSSQAGVKRGY